MTSGLGGVAGVAVLLATISLSGCLGIIEDRTVTEVPQTRTVRRGQDPGRRSTASVDLAGTVLTVTVRSQATCYEESYEPLERSEHVSRQFDPASRPWYVGEWICGGACTVGGIVALAVAPTLSAQADESAGGSALSDRTLAHIGGAAGVAVGVVTLALAIAETVRAMDEDVPLPPGERVLDRRTAECDMQPAPGVSVEGRLGDHRIPLGATGADGRLVVDLRNVLPVSVLQTGSGAGEMIVLAAGEEAGTVPLADYRSTLETQAWAAVTASDTAEAYATYVAAFPDGMYVPEARSRIEAADWARAQAEGTPQALQSYLTAHAGGIHAADAAAGIDASLWSRAEARDDVAGYEAYLAESRGGRWATEARRRIVIAIIDQGDLPEAERRIGRYQRDDPALVAQAQDLRQRIADARRGIVEAAIDRGDLEEAERLIAEYESADPLFAAQAETLRGRIGDVEAGRDRQARRTVERAVRSAERCSDGDPGNTAIAREAYRQIASVRARISAADRDGAIRKVIAACGCGPACAGVEL
jgi:hypothetical protein